MRRGDAWRRDDRRYIDMMLAHVPEGMSAVELRYNRQGHMADYRRLAQEWADMVLAGQRQAADLVTPGSQESPSPTRDLLPTP